MTNRKQVTMTDDGGHFWLDGKFYKMTKWIRSDALAGKHTASFEEVNPEEYDKIVDDLAKKIASYPQVNLLDIVKDALYDLPLKFLERIEKRLNEEEAKAKAKGVQPKVETKHGERGTCVELRIGGKYAMQLRI